MINIFLDNLYLIEIWLYNNDHLLYLFFFIMTKMLLLEINIFFKIIYNLSEITWNGKMVQKQLQLFLILMKNIYNFETIKKINLYVHN